MMLQQQHAIGLAHHGKRKAAGAPEGNERLSKRLSLLNLEQGGARLYVPVESSRPPNVPSPVSPASSAPYSAPAPAAVPPPFARLPALSEEAPQQLQPQPQQQQQQQQDDDSSAMMVDDTKHKVYIYNLDDELSSSESETEGGGKDHARLIFLSDVDKHLREAARGRAMNDPRHHPAPPLPPLLRPICADEDGQMAGMQLVLYNDPSSLSVPRDQDSVRQAILDARLRLRERQREQREQDEQDVLKSNDVMVEDDDAMEMD